MAISITDKSTCPICGRIPDRGEKLLGFCPIFPNEQDALFFFHDRVFHETCVLTHPLGPSALGRLEEYKSRTGPGHRKCRVCGQEITDPDDYTGLG
jgi:hypothetical protein